MRAIKIDSGLMVLIEIDVNTLEDMQKAVGGYIETAHHFPNGDTLFVNEDGVNGNSYSDKFIVVQGAHQPFAGDGLIVGRADENGDTTPAVSLIPDLILNDVISFITTTELIASYAHAM